MSDPVSKPSDDWGDTSKASKASPVGRVTLRPAYENDVWFYRILVIALGGAVLLSVGGAVLIAVMGKQVPEVLVAVGSAAVGALAGVFTMKR